MRNNYWASTHPAWTLDGYECLCGQIYRTTTELFEHVAFDHTYQDAYKILSSRQFKRLIKIKQLTPKEIKECEGD